MQSLPQLYSDREARNAAVNNWNFYKNEVQGDKALAGARSGLALKNADVPATATVNGAFEANRALGFSGGGGAPGAMPPSLGNAKARLVNYSQQGQLVAGKNFYRNTSNQWVDSLAQQFQNAKRQRIQFNSPEYFEFAAQHSKALPWLALGQNVQFVLDDTLYEIYE